VAAAVVGDAAFDTELGAALRFAAALVGSNRSAQVRGRTTAAVESVPAAVGDEPALGTERLTCARGASANIRSATTAAGLGQRASSAALRIAAAVRDHTAVLVLSGAARRPAATTIGNASAAAGLGGFADRAADDLAAAIGHLAAFGAPFCTGLGDAGRGAAAVLTTAAANLSARAILAVELAAAAVRQRAAVRSELGTRLRHALTAAAR